MRTARVVRNALGKMGFTLLRHSRGNEALDLIRALYPVTTTLPLIRLGGTGDWAYLIPDDLDGIAAVFSPGVSNVRHAISS